MIKKVWADPVGSKVISVGIIGLASLAYAKFISVTDDVTFNVALEEVLQITVPVVYVVVGVILYWLILLLKKLLYKKNIGTYTKKQQAIIKNNSLDFSDTGLKLKWKVFFNDDTPYISDLTAFCTYHEGLPIRFMGNNCSIAGCKNAQYNFQEHQAKNIVESILIHEWEKLNPSS